MPIRANQLKNAIEQFAGSTDSVAAATSLQKGIKDFVRKTHRNRGQVARQQYGAIDELAGNRKIVQPRHLYDELQAIIDEAGTQEGGDIVQAARRAREMLETIDDPAIGGYTSQEAVARLQHWSPYSQADVFETASRGYDSVLKSRIYRALRKDIEETPEQIGGNLGEMLKEANASWRKHTAMIQDVERSALGKMIGDDFASELFGAATDTVAPEDVIGKIMRLKPSQARYTADFMRDHMPDMLEKVRAGILNDAIDAAMQQAPSGGIDVQFSPTAFLDALGLKSRQRGVHGRQRLAALFGEDTAEFNQLMDLANIAYRLGDATGRNFSQTSGGNQFFRILGELGRGALFNLKRAGSTGAELFGLRKIAESMDPASNTFGILTRKPVRPLPRVVPRAAAIAGLGAAQYPLQRRDR